MDKSRLALMKIEELEELLHKGSKDTQTEDETPPPEPDEESGGYIDKADLVSVNFNNKTATKTFSISTEGFDFGFGPKTFFISGNLSSTIATSYTIKVYINGYFNTEINLPNVTLYHYAQFLVTTCNYSKETFVMLEIIPSVIDLNTITANGFTLKTNEVATITPTFKTPTDLGRNDNKIKFTVLDGLDNLGGTYQKYGFATLEEGVLYAGECNKENFAFENSNYIREITTYTDKGVDFTTTYYARAATSTTPYCYWYQALYYSDSTLTAVCAYKNLSLDGTPVSLYKNHNNWQVTPAVNSAGKGYTKTLSIAETEMNFGYTTTNGVVSSVNFYRRTDPFKGFESGALPLARNLEETGYLIPCFLLKSGQLYFFIEDTVTEPTLVSGINDHIDKVTHAVFDGSQDKILMFYRSNGYLKCYHISRLSNGYYQGDYFDNMGYGLSEYMPLIGNDAAFVYGDKIFFTKEANKLWLST